MAICLSTTITLAAAILAGSEFTLAWDHSIEHIRWEEVWRVEAGELVLDTVRVRGFGAGMEPAPGAVLKGGVWTWHPGAHHAVLRLTRSPYVPDYQWCSPGQPCRPLSEILGADDGVTEVRACEDSSEPDHIRN